MSREIEFNYVCKHTYQGIDNFYSKTLSLDEIEKSTDIIEDIGNAIDVSCDCLNESCNHCKCNTIFDFGEFDVIVKRQFTGLLDCDGVKIFEGDIVIITDGECSSFGTVEFSNMGYVILINHAGVVNLCDLSDDELRVVGNIHQHPELLA